VGIGGSYMCIYPMNSPGGYQLVGRTLPIWNTFGRAGPFNPEKPWLLEFFDQVRRLAPRLAGTSPSSTRLCRPAARPTTQQPAHLLPPPPPLHPQVRFFQVSEEELEAAREGFQTGQYEIKIEAGSFDMAGYSAMLESIKDEVAAMKERQKAAMAVQVGLPGCCCLGLAAAAWLLLRPGGCCGLAAAAAWRLRAGCWQAGCWRAGGARV
jgi:urea carboxylase